MRSVESVDEPTNNYYYCNIVCVYNVCMNCVDSIRLYVNVNYSQLETSSQQ